MGSIEQTVFFLQANVPLYEPLSIYTLAGLIGTYSLTQNTGRQEGKVDVVGYENVWKIETWMYMIKKHYNHATNLHKHENNKQASK